jgi:transposase
MNCGVQHCRDINAAKNIETIGVGQTHDVKWTGRVCKTPPGAVLAELSTQLEADRSSVAC